MAGRILCIGDSNTYGYDPRSYIGSRYPEDVRWTDRLSGFEVINCGVNGLTVPRDARRYIGQINVNDPDIVIVMLGTNDLCSGHSAEETAGRMDVFLGELAVTGKQIMLISPPLLQFGEWVVDDDMLYESQDLGALYRDVAEKRGCLFADAAEWDIDVTYDGVHFSPEGHATFAQRLEEVLKGSPDF